MPVRLGTVVAPDLGFHRRLGLGALRGHGVLVGVIVVVVEALALNARFVVTPIGVPCSFSCFPMLGSRRDGLTLRFVGAMML